MAYARVQVSRRANARPTVEALVSQLLTGDAGKPGRRALSAWRRPKEDLRRLFRRDYVQDLRRRLRYEQLVKLVETATQMWPRLNRESVKIQGTTRMAAMAASMHLHFKAAPYCGPEGMALRGFYVDRAENLLKRPLVYVNTAHHPVAVLATFCHEMGHHMASSMFHSSNEPVHLFVDAAYASHLDDSSELAADVIVALAAYPEPLARKIFGSDGVFGRIVAQARELSEESFEQVRERIQGYFKVNFDEMKSPEQKARYLAGMIHYAKLRWALLGEYDT